MTQRKIFTYPDEVLRGKCEEITSFDGELKALADDMIQTMYQGIGIGLAGPQVGVMQRIIVLDVSEEGNNPLVLINPEIYEKEGEIRSDEGCLSIPGFRETIKRNARVILKAQNLDGEELKIEADGLLSRCLQHEIDHLDGILFIDHLSRIKKDMFRRWAKRQNESAKEVM